MKIIHPLLQPLLMAAMLLATFTAAAAEPKQQDSYNFTRAMEAIQNKNPEEAMDYLKREVADNPQNGNAYYFMALLSEVQGDYGTALSASNKAVKLIPAKDKEPLADAFNARAQIYLDLNDTVKALKDLNQSLKIKPDYEDTYAARGQLLFDLGRLAESDADYDMLIKLDDGNTTGYMGLGRSANNRQRYDEAVKWFDKVIKLTPGYGQAYAWRARAYQGLEKYPEMVDDILAGLSLNDEETREHCVTLIEEARPLMKAKLKVQIKKEPQNNYWPYILGQMLETEGDYEKAAEQYLAANAIDANSILLERAANCYGRLGRNERALELTEKAIAINPDDTDLPVLKFFLLTQMGRTSEALATIQSLIDTFPDVAWLYTSKANQEAETGMTDEAIEDYSMAIALDPTDTEALARRADLYAAQGKSWLAAPDYNKILEIDTEPTADARTPYALLALGRRQEAFDFMDAMLANDPNAGVYYDAACVYARAGEPTKAMQMLRTAVDKGYLDHVHASRDTDLEPLRGLPEFQALMEQMNQPGQEEATEIWIVRDEPTDYAEPVEVPFSRESGVTKVKCTINGLPLHFVFDTGAADVTLSEVEASFMLKNGYIAPADVIGSQYYVDANGDISEGTTINLRKVDFGGLELENVRASVVRNQRAPLLLGQSVLGRLGKVEIDNPRSVIRITPLR